MSIIDGAYWEEEMRPKTNADKLRKMPDTGLAYFLYQVENGGRHDNPRGIIGWLDWLKQESKEEQNDRNQV